jgi:4'-phosphopantetheinyl transferase
MAMVELYYMTIDPGGEELGPAILALLPEEKRERLGRTIRRDDRNRLAWGGILLGHLVALRTGQPFPAVAFGRSETGKPFLREPAGVHFNLAHSGRLIVAALSASPVGVDVEEIGPVDSPAATAGTFMSEKELRLFMRGSGEERLAFFYRVWTAKESFIKCTGEGFSADPRRLSVTFGKGGISIRRDNSVAGSWSFREYSIDSGYSVCACSAGIRDFAAAREILQGDILRHLRDPS